AGRAGGVGFGCHVAPPHREVGMEIRRLLVISDTIHSEGGLSAVRPVTGAGACAVIGNPLAGKMVDDLSDLVALGAGLGELLVQKALKVLPNPALVYGKAAIVGLAGDIEHAAAILHPRMGKPMPRGHRRWKGDHSVECESRARWHGHRRAAIRQ